MDAMTKETPKDWKHFRIQPVKSKRYSVRTFWLNFPVDKGIRSLAGFKDQTEGLTLAAALKAGAILEQTIEDLQSSIPGRQSRRKNS